MKRYALAALLLAVIAWDAHAATLIGRVVAVGDGDTVTVLTGQHRQFKIRLSGIDAPEKKQAFGSYARDKLAQHVAGQSVVIEWSKTDRYGRILGKVEIDGEDINLTQVREGSAWVYTRYLRELAPADRERYVAAQRLARAQHRGLWRDATAQPPWQWRRQRRPVRPD